MTIPLPKHLRTKNANQAKSRVQERKTAKAFGGQVVRGSGAGRVKGDVRRMGLCRIEAKTTKNLSFSVTRQLIEKLEASVPTGSTELPFFEITVDDGDPHPKTVYVFPAWAAGALAEVMEARGDD